MKPVAVNVSTGRLSRTRVRIDPLLAAVSARTPVDTEVLERATLAPQTGGSTRADAFGPRVTAASRSIEPRRLAA